MDASNSIRGNKLIAALLLIVIVGFLGLGVMQSFDSGTGAMTNTHGNCFTTGAGCGPVQHIIFHSFVVPAMIMFIGGFIILTIVSLNSFVRDRTLCLVEGPPPKYSIV